MVFVTKSKVVEGVGPIWIGQTKMTKFDWNQGMMLGRDIVVA